MIEFPRALGFNERADLHAVDFQSVDIGKVDFDIAQIKIMKYGVSEIDVLKHGAFQVDITKQGSRQILVLENSAVSKLPREPFGIGDAAGKQQLHDFLLAEHHGRLQHAAAVGIHGRQQGSIGIEQLRQLLRSAALHRRRHVAGGAIVDKQSPYIELVVDYRAMQRGLAPIVLCVELGAGLNQRLHDVDGAVYSG
ncbi:MAG TPA: hypothetical protein VGN42_13440, partial [Pirellulales bacterium]|nr:hypothetical protein [Pirellulales bacterium]